MDFCCCCCCRRRCWVKTKEQRRARLLRCRANLSLPTTVASAPDRNVAHYHLHPQATWGHTVSAGFCEQLQRLQGAGVTAEAISVVVRPVNSDTQRLIKPLTRGRLKQHRRHLVSDLAVWNPELSFPGRQESIKQPGCAVKATSEGLKCLPLGAL